MFPPPALVPLVLSKFLAEHVNGQLRHLLLVAPCWMEAPWLPTVLNMLADVPQWCPLLKDLIVDVLVGQDSQGSVISAFNPLAAQQCALCRWVLFLGLSGSGGSKSNVYIKGLPAVLEGVGQVVCLTGFTKQCPLCPKLANFLLHLFQVGLAWGTIGIYCSAISAFFGASSHSQGILSSYHFETNASFLFTVSSFS